MLTDPKDILLKLATMLLAEVEGAVILANERFADEVAPFEPGQDKRIHSHENIIARLESAHVATDRLMEICDQLEILGTVVGTVTASAFAIPADELEREPFLSASSLRADELESGRR